MQFARIRHSGATDDSIRQDDSIRLARWLAGRVGLPRVLAQGEGHTVDAFQIRTREATSFPIIEGVRVDIHALGRLAHCCDPHLCRHTKCCCKSYEIVVDRNEARTVVGMLPNAARYARRLRDGSTFHDPIDTTEGGLCLASTGCGRCVFAFTAPEGLRCSLHAAALDLGLPPASVKPKACTLWPLFFDESEPPLLTVQEDAFDFPCNRRTAGTALDAGVAEIIGSVFGDSFLASVRDALRSP